MAAEEPDSGVVLREGTEVVRDQRRPGAAVVGRRRARPARDPRRARPGTTAAGRSPRRSSRCRSTSTGWPAGCWRPAARSPGSTCTGCRAPVTAGRTRWSTAPASGAKFLAADPTVYPVQGQVVLVEQVGLERWWLDERRRRGADVRRTALARHRRRWHRRGGRVEPDPLAGGGRGDPAAGAAAGPGAGRRGGDRPQGRAAARRGRRCGWSGSVTWCTATATAVPG